MFSPIFIFSRHISKPIHSLLILCYSNVKAGMRRELKLSISPIVLLALVLAITSEYCQPSPVSSISSAIRNQSPLNPYCYIKSFSSEPPELQTTTTMTSMSISSAAMVGTTSVSTTTTL